ncbi:MAG: inorganic diphosphatase [Candidatus Zambryskibacteria bacterium]|nr:inorganic diphosphatase [Candidatus Zambryskibacteria bacterium]
MNSIRGESSSIKIIYGRMNGIKSKQYMNDSHTNSTDYLGKTITIQIDRQLGSKHPKHNFIYKLNYGFVPNTVAPDGEELDAYLLGVDIPVETYTGRCIAVIHRTNDDDDKLVVAPEGKEFSDDDIRALTHFQEQFFKSEIVR